MAAGPGQLSSPRHRRRRGDPSLSLGQAHSDALTVTAAGVAATAGLYSAVWLANDSQYGRYLHVVALSGYVVDPSADCTLARGIGTPPGTKVPNLMPVDPTTGQLTGTLYTGSVASLPTNIRWYLGGGGIPFAWGYEFPVIILASGQYLQVSSTVVNATLHVSLAWLDLTFT